MALQDMRSGSCTPSVQRSQEKRCRQGRTEEIGNQDGCLSGQLTAA